MEVKIIITTQNYYVPAKGKRINNNHTYEREFSNWLVTK